MVPEKSNMADTQNFFQDDVEKNADVIKFLKMQHQHFEKNHQLPNANFQK